MLSILLTFNCPVSHQSVSYLNYSTPLHFLSYQCPRSLRSLWVLIFKKHWGLCVLNLTYSTDRSCVVTRSLFIWPKNVKKSRKLSPSLTHRKGLTGSTTTVVRLICLMCCDIRPSVKFTSIEFSLQKFFS